MVEHTAWIGSNYSRGISEAKIAIVGYSHWSNDPDNDDFTLKCIANVRDGIWKDIRFFNFIQEYFQFDDRAGFWNKVMFFNFVPSKIGGDEDRYLWATPEQQLNGRTRVLRLIKAHRPDKMFVFSRKAWTSFPLTTEEEAGGSCVRLSENCHPAFNYGHYSHVPVLPTSTVAIGLRHPQYANTGKMQYAVAAGLAL